MTYLTKLEDMNSDCIISAALLALPILFSVSTFALNANWVAVIAV